MTATTAQEDLKVCLERLVWDESRNKLDTIHQWVADLFKIPDADNLNDVVPANMMDKITKIRTTDILIKSPINGEMMMLHQIYTVGGGDILDKVEENSGLVGENNSAIPMKIVSKNSTYASKVECHSWTKLCMVTIE